LLRVPEQFSVGSLEVPPEEVKVIEPVHEVCWTPLEFTTHTTGTVAPLTEKADPEAATVGCWWKTKESPAAPMVKELLVAPWNVKPSVVAIWLSLGSVATIWYEGPPTGLGRLTVQPEK
jgi:hypothetical protein